MVTKFAHVAVRLRASFLLVVRAHLALNDLSARIGCTNRFLSMYALSWKACKDTLRVSLATIQFLHMPDLRGQFSKDSLQLSLFSK